MMSPASHFKLDCLPNFGETVSFGYANRNLYNWKDYWKRKRLMTIQCGKRFSFSVMSE